MINSIFSIKSPKLNISQKKLKIILNLLVGKNYINILNIFKKTSTKNYLIIWEIIHNAIHQIINLYNVNINSIQVNEIIINKGLIRTRKRPGPKGRALDIQKKQSSFIIKFKINHIWQEK